VNPKPAEPVVACDATANAILSAWEKQRGKPPSEDVATVIRLRITERCTQDVWGGQAKACFVGKDADVDGCFGMLTKQQQESLQDDIAAHAKRDVDAT